MRVQISMTQKQWLGTETGRALISVSLMVNSSYLLFAACCTGQ